MPTVAQNYTITKLEFCGLAINIASFSHLLKRVDFDVVVDHLAIPNIMKCKSGPATNRIKRLLEGLCSYKYNPYCLKGKDMGLSDFLSRLKGDKSHPHDVIPISFNLHSISTGHYYNCFKLPLEIYRIVTISKTKLVQIKIPKAHKAYKVVYPALNLKTQARGKEILKPISVTTMSVSQPQRIILPVLPR